MRPTLPSRLHSRRPGAPLAALCLLAAAATAPAALQELPDDSLSGVTGEGLVFAWTDFRMLMDPSSYLEQRGSALSNTCTSSGNTAGNYNCWRRGDLRWYGLSVSATGTTTGQAATAGAWNTGWTSSGGNMTQCANAGINGLGCPRGGPIGLFAAHDNPYILRVKDYAGDDSANSAIGNGIVTYQGVTSSTNWNAGGSRQTVLEWLAPTAQDYYRMAFWGEIEAGRGAAGAGLLKSQTIVQGNAAGSVLRFYKYTQTATSPGLQAPFDPTLGAAGCTDSGCNNVDTAGSAYNNRSLAMVYESRLQGDFRFSVAQSETTPALGTPVDFHHSEGMYFRNVKAFFPLGQSFYQALTLNVPRNTATNLPVVDGNFTLEIPLIPNRTAVFTRFYSLNTAPGVGGTTSSVQHSWDYGYATARAAMLHNTALTADAVNYLPDAAPNTTNYPAVNANYHRTHGYSRWGDWYSCQGEGCILPLARNSVAEANAGIGRNAWNSSGDGIFFWGISAYNAYAYRTDTIDVRPALNGNGTVNTDANANTTISYYSNFAACTPANSTAYSTCGYGGAYNGAADYGKTTTSTSILPAENAFYNAATTGMGANANRPVISVPANSALNIGDARVEGMQIHYLRFTSSGAQF